MINKETLKFLKDLKINNSKEWLDENRANYDFAKKDVLTLTGQLITAVAGFDETILNANLQPKNCISRLKKRPAFC